MDGVQKNNRRNNSRRNNSRRNNGSQLFQTGRLITQLEKELQENRELTMVQQLRMKRRLQQARRIRTIFFAAVVLVCFVLILGISIGTGAFRKMDKEEQDEKTEETAAEITSLENMQILRDTRWERFYTLALAPPAMSIEMLDFNEYSRPGISLPCVENIFVHYTANPGTSAAQNRSYFQLLGETGERSASAHFIIGIQGEIIQCIPTSEIAYAVMTRNFDSISIECCYEDESGIFTRETYESLLRLTAWLLHKFYLTPEDVLRHYDQGGKNCPKYYVENEQAWEIFLEDLSGYMESLSEGVEEAGADME